MPRWTQEIKTRLSRTQAQINSYDDFDYTLYSATFKGVPVKHVVE
jgi:hypothetical protein